MFDPSINDVLVSLTFFLDRNWSLTKEEIASFWRLKKMEEEELFFLKASYRFSKEDKVYSENHKYI